MAQAILTNIPPINTTDTFMGVWALTRGLLAAGWKYKGSGDATATGVKSTDGNFLGDKWGIGGGVGLNSTAVQSGTGPNITANTDGTCTVTFAGTTFTANSVGRFLLISGCTNAGNNGLFRIVTYTSATSIKIFNSGAALYGAAVTENTATAAWSELQGGANGTITTVSTGGATPTRAIFTVSSGTPFVAPVAFPVNRGSVGDRITIAGGAVGANNGTFMITRVISSTSVEIDNSAANATGETNNGTLIWTECSPSRQLYPYSIYATAAGPWFNLQGPSTLKIPIGNNVASAAFVRNESVTQTTSGATGTVLGVVTDTGTSLGYLVIEPRLNGTGGGVRGWTTGSTDTVTGALSGATVTTANITPIEFVRELVLWKGSSTAGHIYAQTVDQSIEAASRFSVLAAGAGVTNLVAPGGPAATFPTPGSYVVQGTANAGSAATGTLVWHANTLNSSGDVHILCATCIENAMESADGSWTILQGEGGIGNSVYDCYSATSFMHLDGSEEGDVDPYVHYIMNGATPYTGTRTAHTSSSGVSTTQFMYATYVNRTFFRGWRRRGFSTNDAFQEFSIGTLVGSGNSSLVAANYTTPGKVSHPSLSIQIRDPLYVASYQLNQKMRKGYSRWWFITEGGLCGRLHSNGTYIQVCSILTSNGGGPYVAGPWDGTTSPSNQTV